MTRFEKYKRIIAILLVVAFSFSYLFMMSGKAYAAPSDDPFDSQDGSSTGTSGEQGIDPDGTLIVNPDGTLIGNPDGTLTNNPEGNPNGTLTNNPEGNPDGTLIGNPDGTTTGNSNGTTTGNTNGTTTGNTNGTATGKSDGTVIGNTKTTLTAEEADAEAEAPAYNVTADAKPQFAPFKGMDAWKDRAAIKTPTNTYVLSVATGVSAGDTVQYFAIRYTDTKGNARTQFVFPGIDANSRSAALLKYYANGKNIDKPFGMEALASLNYQEDAQKEGHLDSWSTQEFVFRTEKEIKTVDSIDVYLAYGQWTVQGIAVYKMEAYKGYEEYGLVSGKHFLDFQGNMIAEMIKMNPGTLTLSTRKIDSVFCIGGPDSSYFTIQNYEGTVKSRDFASANSLYSFRFEITDLKDAGVSAFLNSSAVTLSDDNGIVEDILLEFQYRDTHGWTRNASLPMVLSSYIMASKSNPDGTAMGFAQKGDVIGFQGYLPEFETILGQVKLSVGEAARTTLEENGISVSKATKKMNANLAATAKDGLRFASISLHKGGCMAYINGGVDNMGVRLQGATVDYVFENEVPLLYFTTTTSGGQPITANGTYSFFLRTYTSGSPISAKPVYSGMDQYLITISTTDKPRAGTTGDVTFRLDYVDQDGETGHTQTYSVKTEAETFLGPWPASDGSSYVTKYGLQTGNSVSFLVEARDVQEFTGAEVGLVGNDEWEMKNITIAYIDSCSRRQSYLAPPSITDSNYYVTRDMVLVEIFNLMKVDPTIVNGDGEKVNGDGTTKEQRKQLVDENGNLIYDSDGNPVYVDEDQRNTDGYRLNGGQLFTPDTTLQINFGNGTATNVQDKDYSKVRYKMSYEDTQVDWGFFKKKKTYDVVVQVAQDSEIETGNGDAGSVNYFYFQLIFANGHSAYVQANQQLAGDAFRSGRAETFAISTNRDYGELQEVRILPEDLATDATPFDKLNIDRITVTERTTGGTYISHVIENVGWIDVDYRDEAEKGSSRGLQARSAKEIARSYEVTYHERSVKLLCELSTLAWEGNYHQFEGSVTAEVQYIQASDNAVKTIDFDVVQLLAAYMDKSATSMEAATNVREQKVPTKGQGTISDPEWMFRAGKTDRFILPAISDLYCLKSITLTGQTKNNEGAYLRIGKVTVSQIIEDGPLQLTANEEYYRNLKTKKLCVNEDDKVFTTFFPMGQIRDMETIRFTENKIVWSSEQWATPVSRIPESSDDTVNVYLYPKGNRGGYYTSDETPKKLYDNLSSEFMTASINLKYSIPFSQTMAAACTLKAATDGAGNMFYYATGLETPNMVSPEKLTIRAASSTGFDHAIVQHVRGGVVISNTQFIFDGMSAKNGLKVEGSGGNIYLDDTEESIYLLFGTSTKPQTLQEVNNDIAVAFTYTSSIDGGAKEYSSPYVYLTDLGYSTIYEGLTAELKFDIPYVRRITGYKIAAYGNLSGNISASAGAVYHVDEREDVVTGGNVATARSLRLYTSIADGYTLSDRVIPHKSTSKSMYGENSVTPVDLTFTTTEAAKAIDNSEDAAVRMRVTYTDFTGMQRIMWYDDITKYIVGGAKAFTPGDPPTPQTVRFFLPEMGADLSVQSIELVPYNASMTINSPSTGEPVNGASVSVDTLVQQMQDGTGDSWIFTPQFVENLTKLRGAAWTISHVDYDAGFGTNTVPKAVDQTFQGLSNGAILRLATPILNTYVTKNSLMQGQVVNHLKQLSAKGGDIIGGTVTVRGVGAGSSTFKARLYRMVGEAGEDITAGNLTVTDANRSFSFTVPQNLTDSLVVYKIEISPVDEPTLVDQIMITVESEAITLETQYALNGAAAIPVTNNTAIVSAKSNDEIKVTTKVTNSTGADIFVYRVNNEGGSDEAMTSVSDSKSMFSYTIPENTTGNVVQYRIEITPVGDPDTKHTIYVSVESDPTEDTSEQDAPGDSGDSGSGGEDAGGGTTPDEGTPASENTDETTP